MNPKYYSYEHTSWEHVRSWAKRKTVHGETCSAVINDLGERNASVHSHPHEQISYIVSGHTDFALGDRIIPVSPGDILVIPPNVPHGGGSNACVMVDFFCPKREEFTECVQLDGAPEPIEKD
jgi:mannose-6-phosphate isomerase-like protein (cupin superfamily)